MIRMTLVTVFALSAVLCSAFNTVEKLDSTPIVSEDLERMLERQMLSSIEYIEENEEIELGFDPYFYLPYGFNAYQGMEFKVSEIEYIEFEE